MLTADDHFAECLHEIGEVVVGPISARHDTAAYARSRAAYDRPAEDSPAKLSAMLVVPFTQAELLTGNAYSSGTITKNRLNTSEDRSFMLMGKKLSVPLAKRKASTHEGWPDFWVHAAKASNRLRSKPELCIGHTVAVIARVCFEYFPGQQEFPDGSSNGARGRQRGGSSAVWLNTCFVWRRWSHDSASKIGPSEQMGTPLGERQTERQRTASKRPPTMGRTRPETPELQRWEPVRRSHSSRLTTWFRPLQQFGISAHLLLESNHQVVGHVLRVEFADDGKTGQ